jgi:hypothetical protein
MVKLILFFLFVLVVLFVLAVRYLPWWGVLLLVAGTFLFVRFGIKWLIVALFLMPFKAKGAVLKNALAELHSATWEPAPAKPAQPEPATRARAALGYDGPDDPAIEPDVEQPSEAAAVDNGEVVADEEEGPLDHYRIDVTITPRPKTGGFQHWEPSELRLVPFTNKARAKLSEDDDAEGEPVDVQIFREGRFEPDEEGKYFGPQRVRLLMAVPIDSPRRLKFRYYLELFGDLTLPPSVLIVESSG